MSKFLKTMDYCIDLESVLWVTNSNRPFYGVGKGNKCIELKQTEYRNYPISFNATQRELTFYLTSNADSTDDNKAGRHSYKYEYPIVMQDFLIKDEYEINEKETELILLLERSKELEPTSLKNFEQVKEKILSYSNFIELEIDDDAYISRPIIVHNIENLIINLEPIYLVDRSKNQIVVNFKGSNFDSSISICFKNKEKCDTLYTKLIMALGDK